MNDQSDSGADIHAGGCLCGAVRYRLQGPLRAVVNCHCGQCRRFHGHYAAYTTVSQDRLNLVEDAGLRWFASSSSAERGFCRQCGSSLFWKPKAAETVAVAAGTLDQPTGLETVGDIFVADQGDYYDIEGGRPSRQQGGGDVLAAGRRAKQRG